MLGRVAAEVKSVVVTVDGRDASAGMANGIYFALVPTKVVINPSPTFAPTVTSVAYNDNGDDIGDDQQTC